MTKSLRSIQKPITTHQTEIGQFILYPNIIVGEIYQGIHITYENTLPVVHLCRQYYDNDEPVVYISNREYSYSKDPLGFLKALKQFPNIIAFSIVAQSKQGKMVAKLERFFVKRPLVIFDTLEDAFLWAENFLEQKNWVYL